ncbi:hypothetical protein ACVXHA_18095 [Escherichia coli]
MAQKGAQALERGIAILQYLEKSGEVRRLAIFLSIWICRSLRPFAC